MCVCPRRRRFQDSRVNASCSGQREHRAGGRPHREAIARLGARIGRHRDVPPLIFLTRALHRPPLPRLARRRSLPQVSYLYACRVSCTFILAKQKQRVTVPGMVGWSLLETAQHHNLPIPGEPADEKWDYET